jgi:hypothetical protein
METRQILIKIITEVGNAGVVAARKAINETGQALTGFRGRLQGVTASFRNFASGVANVRAGMQRLRSSILGTGGGLGLFNNLFGRVTKAMLVWSAWRNVGRGFRAIADAVVGGNVRMQTAVATFTALSGGSRELGETFVGITRNLGLQFGANIDDMLANAKRLPTQIGSNFQAFEKIMKTSLVLGILDPVQGAEGAMIALTNALEGTAQGFRSLVQRFEISSFGAVRRAIAETSNPLEALNRVIEEAGIDVDQFLAEGLNTLGVAFTGIINIAREFFRLIGEAPLLEFTKDVVRLRDFLIEAVQSGAFEGLARAIGDELTVILKQVREFFSEIFLGGQELTPEAIFLGLVSAIEGFIIFLVNAATTILDLISLIARGINLLFGGTDAPADLGVTAAANAAEGAVNRLGDTIKQTAEETTQAVADTAEAAATEVEAVVTRSAAGIAPALAKVREGGKRTIEEFVGGLTEGVSAAGLQSIADELIRNVINLEAQVEAQEKSVDNIKAWVDEAAKEVEAARDKITLFDLATADIPERFTRARRRQLELEVFNAEQEQKRRQETLKIAQAQLKATKEALKVQERILSLVERQLKEQEKLEKSDKRRGVVPREFTPPTIDLAEQERRIEAFRAQFAERLAPSFARIRESLGGLADSVRDVVNTVGQAGANFGRFITAIDGFLARISSTWEGLNPHLRRIILGVLGLIVLKRAVAPFAIPFVLSFSIKVAGALLASGGALFTAITSGAIFTGGVAASTLILPLVILATLSFLGREELGRWITGERPRELIAIIGFAIDPATRDLVEQEISDITERLFGLRLPEFEVVAKPILKATGLDFGLSAVSDVGNIVSSITDLLGGSSQEVDQATSQGIIAPITNAFQGLFNTIIGNSIVPEMMTGIVEAFTQLPIDLQPHLDELQNIMLLTMQNIQLGWLTNIGEMMAATIELIQLQQQLAAISLSNLSNVNSSLSVRMSGNQSLNLNLNANETRRLMREGVFQGMIDIGNNI